MATQQVVQSTFPHTVIEPLLSVKEAAYLLGISVKTIRDWVQNRKIAYVKAGTRVMIHPETIRDFVRQNTRVAERR
jgi:excisionase family DNA binding protein